MTTRPDHIEFDQAAAAGSGSEIAPARRWVALCEACRYCLADEAYQAAEAAAGPNDDPACPRCSRRAWTFWPEE